MPQTGPGGTCAGTLTSRGVGAMMEETKFLKTSNCFIVKRFLLGSLSSCTLICLNSQLNTISQLQDRLIDSLEYSFECDVVKSTSPKSMHRSSIFSTKSGS